MARTDLAIVGAGPAGMAAARVATAHGLAVTVIDEQPRAGGQILRQPPASFRVDRWLADRIYRPQQSLLQQCAGLDGVRWQHATTVLGSELTGDGITLSLNTPGGVDELRAERLLLATGCHDMPVTFPGSTLPGVMATGGIQAFVKSQQIVPGERFVFSGSHPLQLIVADQILQAGGEVAAVLFSQPRSLFWRLLRQSPVLLRYPAKLLYFTRACARLMRRGVAIQFGRVASSAHGEGRLQRVEIADSGTLEARDTIACDRLGIGFGFLSNSQLASQAGLECHWSDSAGGWLARTDEWMRGSLPGVYVAGELTGIGGADVSQREGEIAGLAAAMDAGVLAPGVAAERARPARRALRPLYRFADVLSAMSHPGAALLRALMTRESTLCKCEEVTVGTVRALLDENPFTADLNALKLQSRCGMGMCQGRYCQYQLRTLLHSQRPDLATGDDGFQARFPVKPVSIGALATTPTPEEQ
ncbi:NAD(P)/FAD-dependent oxidoreductase [Parahaliea mediterranea]|uniref:FAD-dependent oxidoreductase n=1 Tax=Parahaliea mediterranea TaxID=651086 RepID=A0A939DCN1_9GAMM|nr:NAD(P)/FAD-dependent oxidoreductase [Parahaliea mediterranea]MBN7795594.1 FAD-dependent oxidoreductase [Parahaliea mediterranea]